MFWWIVAAFVAYFIKGVCGFANTLIFSSILSFGNRNIDISPVEIVVSYPANLLMTLKERKSIRWDVCLPLTAVVLLSSIPGILLLKYADSTGVKILFGLALIGVGTEMLIREIKQKENKKPSRLTFFVITIVSGVLCGLYGMGALLAAYITRVTEGTSALKANISFVFFAENTFRIICYLIGGIITVSTVRQSLLLYPVMLLGLGAGIFSCRFLNEKKIKIIVILMLILSGISLVVKNM